MTPAADVVSYWQAAGRERWFRKDEAFDRDFRERFLPAHEAAARGELDGWLADAQGALALLILLDQFPRNAFRGTARVYATDAKAREVADAAIAAGFDRACDPALRPFFYMPFMHSEQLGDLQRCVHLMQAVGGDSQRFAAHHRDIVERFGRFPHRNAVLGRPSTPEEEQFLAQGGFAG
jgi:uncharacterized protein (DUF924 family)